jgi:neuropeptide S receptor 1
VTEQFTLLWILLIVIVAGNVGVLCTLHCGRSRKSRMNYFITHLAFADLCVGLINVLTDIVWKITVAWYAGNVACKVIRFWTGVVTYASTYVLVALSIDRYDAIRHPMKFSGSWKRAKCLISTAWFFSVLFSVPMLVLYEENTIKNKVQCWIELKEPWKWQLYMTLVSVTLFFIPAAIIATCYAVIIVTIWSKNAKGFIKNPKTTNGSDNSRRASSRGLIPRAKVKTVKITFVIVSVFIICWSPYIIFDLLQVFEQIPSTQTNMAIATFVQSLAPLNSAANPVIYFLFSTHFCRTLWSLPPFRWLFKKKKRRNGDSTTNTQSSSLSEFLTNTHKRRIEKTSTTINAHAVLIH